MKAKDFRNSAFMQLGNGKLYEFRAGPDGEVISREVEIREEPLRSRGIADLYETVSGFIKDLYKTHRR